MIPPWDSISVYIIPMADNNHGESKQPPMSGQWCPSGGHWSCTKYMISQTTQVCTSLAYCINKATFLEATFAEYPITFKWTWWPVPCPDYLGCLTKRQLRSFIVTTPFKTTQTIKERNIMSIITDIWLQLETTLVSKCHEWMIKCFIQLEIIGIWCMPIQISLLLFLMILHFIYYQLNSWQNSLYWGNSITLHHLLQATLYGRKQFKPFGPSEILGSTIILL